jgi:2-hydroxychromene-2-carboxylate isomerase
LALAGLLALKEDGATLQWHPFDHKPLNRPASPADNEDRSTMHRRIRGEYVVADIERYAPHRLGDIHRATDCSVANMGLLWLKTQSSPGVEAYVVAVFEALWLDDLDITKAPLIRDLVAQAAGPDLDLNDWDTFLQGAGETALAAAKADAAAAGASYAPTMKLGDEPFQGRAQLPLVRARLLAGI